MLLQYFSAFSAMLVRSYQDRYVAHGKTGSFALTNGFDEFVFYEALFFSIAAFQQVVSSDTHITGSIVFFLLYHFIVDGIVGRELQGELWKQ